MNPEPVTLWGIPPRADGGYVRFCNPGHKEGVEYRALPAADFDALLRERDALAERVRRLEEALRFYADEENHKLQLVMADTLGANVPKLCQDKEAHAREKCEPFNDVGLGDIVKGQVVPHECSAPDDDETEEFVLAIEPRYWGTEPVLKDGGAKARAALGAKGGA